MQRGQEATCPERDGARTASAAPVEMPPSAPGAAPGQLPAPSGSDAHVDWAVTAVAPGAGASGASTLFPQQMTCYDPAR